MKCPTPLTILNPSYGKMNDRIGTMFMQVPCGKCLICFENKRKEWSTKLMLEHKYSVTSHFITLTYDDEHYLSEEPSVRDVQLFLKRLRKAIEPFKIRYYLVSEHGDTFGRLHYHALLFNFPSEFEIDICQILNDSWGLGFIQIGSVTPASINYVTKYLFKNRYESVKSESGSPDKIQFREIQLMSRKPSIGSAALTDSFISSSRCKATPTIHINGSCRGFPRNIRGKVFDTESRKRLYGTLCAGITNETIESPFGTIGNKPGEHINYLQGVIEKKYRR